MSNSSSSAVGAWSAWNFSLDATAQEVFAKATAGLVGVKYTALAYASQVVAGTNYAFICEAQLVSANPIAYPVVMHVNQPLGGAPIISGIQKLGPAVTGNAGGWSSWSFTVSTEAQQVFDAAGQGFVGVNYKPIAFNTQVVAGTNYCYLCEGTVVVEGAPVIAALVFVNQPLPGQGHPHRTEIQAIPTH